MNLYAGIINKLYKINRGKRIAKLDNFQWIVVEMEAIGLIRK